MKSEQTHIIKSQCYEIQLDNDSEAHNYQSKISKLQEYTISGVLEKVMDAHDSPQFLDQFDEILLDIGTISTINFEKELAYKIEEAFSHFFKNNSYENDTLKIGKRKKIYDKHIEQFEFFLKNGYVKWDTSLSVKPIEIFELLLKNNKEELIVLLKKHGKKEVIRKRLIAQFDDHFLELLVVGTIGDKDGTYINQYRQRIVKQQHDYVLIEIDSGSFRNAIWEITLAYIFIETRGYSNQKNVLKYLIYKVAQKYRLTYKNLLNAIVSGVKNDQIEEGATANFEKILFILQQEEDEKSKNAFSDISKSNISSNFIETLSYYLKHNSLPVNSKLSSFEILCKNLKDNIVHHPKEFYIFFNKHIQNTSNIDKWITRFPDEVLNTIVVQSSNRIFIKLSVFLEQIDIIAKQLQLKSSTLETIHSLSGKIFLNTHKTALSPSKDEIVEFLYQIINYVSIDKAFTIILKRYVSEKSTAENKLIRSFISELTANQKEVKRSTKTILQDTPVFSNLSKKIYSLYNKRSALTLAHFQQQLYDANYSDATLKLVLLLLEVCSSTDRYTIEEITAWIAKRNNELLHKGKQGVNIQVLQIVTLLNSDKTIIEGVKNALKKEQKTEAIAIPSMEDTKNNIVSESIIDQLIKAIYKQFYYRTTQNLDKSIAQLLTVFSRKNNIAKDVLLLALKGHVSNRNEHEILKRIIAHRLVYKNTPLKVIDIQYRSDVVQYYCIHGKLPWWIENKSLTVLQEYVKQLIEEFPDQFKIWYGSAKNKRSIIQLMDASTYKIFIKHVNPSTATLTANIKTIIDDLLEKEISGIKHIRLSDMEEIHYLILNYAYQTPTFNSVEIMEYLIKKMSSMFAVNTLDVKILIRERLYDSKIDFSLKKDLKLWLKKELKSAPEATDSIVKIESFVDDQLGWKKVLDNTSKKDGLPLLKKAYNEAPNELLFCLKQISFRKKLIKRLDSASHIEFIKYFIRTGEDSRFLSIVTLFKKLRRQLSGSAYDVLWNRFVDFTLLKIAIDTPLHWTGKDWSIILYQSIANVSDNSVSINTLAEVLVGSSEEMVAVVEDVKKIMESEKEEATHKKEAIILEEIEEEVTGESVYINNAGMILLGPYISMLFERLKLVENGKFKDSNSIQKAIHVLQYAVTGKEAAEEQTLVLNKIICGIPISEPIERNILITIEEKELITSLLKAVISSWSILGNTTVEGLRETFLCRNGQINIEDDGYILKVEEKTYDMLLDQIPWSIGRLKLSWMKKMIKVIWRK